MNQLDLFPDDTAKSKTVDQEKVDKAKSRKTEGGYFKDQRVKASPLTVQAELAKMKEILNMPKSGGVGGGGIDLEGKMGRNIKPKFSKGGTVSSASKRADGCAIKGKTKGRLI